MYRVIKKKEIPDVTAFIQKIGGLSNFFVKDTEIFITRAPGRLDLMGGIADYCGSLMLPMPIREATKVALQKCKNRQIEIISEDNGKVLEFVMSLDDFCTNGNLIDYETANIYFKQNAENHWASYICGIFLVLAKEKNISFEQGVKIYISSDVPLGKGVSSSASLEIAVMQAVCAAFGIEIETKEKAILCQKVENLIVGAPCGVMDQMASLCGEKNQLLALVCQPAKLLGTRKIPAELEIWGIDSGIRHSVGGGDYGSVRTGAFIGYRIIADLVGLDVQITDKQGVVVINDKRWHGYLANLTPKEFEKEFAEKLPFEISGAEFLEKYKGITDTVTTVNCDKIYAVFNPTVHPIYENWRVHLFEKLLSENKSEENLNELGKLMYQAHESYSACGLGSDGTDLLVELVKKSANLYGAKITGGGSGGTVAVLGKKGSDSEIESIAQNYQKQTGYHPYIFRGSSMGAAEFGFIKLGEI